MIVYHGGIGGGGSTILFAITVLAFAVGLIVVPITRLVAIAVGLIDRPDAHRKIHGREIAVGGGVGVLFTVVVVLFFFTFLSDTWYDRAGRHTTEFVGFTLAAGLLCLVGIWDDWKGLGGKKKLLGQALSASIIILTGPAIHDFSLFGFPLHLGILIYPLAIIWILGAINSVNLIDGMDGLASSVGVSMMGAVAIIGLYYGHSTQAFIALAAAGALLAFLVYNFYPASIFLGDTGSMLIGLGTGSLLLRVTLNEQGVIPIAIPIAVMTIPLFDTTVAVIRRKFTGRSIYTTDRGHIHHCFRRKGMNVRWTMSCIALLSVIAGLGAIASAVSGQDIFAMLGSLVVILLLAGTKSFGHNELQLLSQRLKSFFAPFVSFSNKQDHDLRVQLQGEGNWEELWEELKVTAQRMGLSRVRLDVNLPAMHEGYYAEWRSRSRSSDEVAAWNAVVPLVVNARAIGRVELSGDRSHNPSFQNWLNSVGELVEEVELRVTYLVQSHNAVATKPVVVHVSDGPNNHAPKMPEKLIEKEVISSAS